MYSIQMDLNGTIMWNKTRSIVLEKPIALICKYYYMWMNPK
jgi:hypothetical protein